MLYSEKKIQYFASLFFREKQVTNQCSQNIPHICISISIKYIHLYTTIIKCVQLAQFIKYF